MTQNKQKPWNTRQKRRRTGSRGEPKKHILIVCEGTETEPNYFKSFKVTSAHIHVKGSGRHTKHVVNFALGLQKEAENKGIPYDQVWCVFDRDSFEAQDFKEALQTAKKENIQVAYSNEAFELWYLLHFHYCDTGIPRAKYASKLTKVLGKPYMKNDKNMYKDLRDKQEHAIQHAKKLLTCYTSLHPEKDNPSTTVHLLVEELNKNL